MLITVFNPPVDHQERTYLSQSYPAAVSAIEVKNNNKLSVNNRLMIGEMGQEKTEIVTLASVNANGTSLTIGPTLFSHEANTPITVLQFDQVKFYRSTAGINGPYTLLTTVDLDVDNQNLETTYDDTSAQDGYYYKVSMYNALAGVESDQGDPLPAITGWKTNQVGYIIDQILREVSDPNEQFVTRTELLGYFNNVNDDLQNNTARPYRFLYTRQILDRTANLNYFYLPTNSDGSQKVWKFDRLDYRFLDTTTNPDTDTTNTVRIFDLEYFRNRYSNNLIDSTTADDVIQAAAINDATNAVNYYPASATSSTYGCFFLYYWKYFTRLESEGDTFETYSSLIYKYFALSKYYYKRSVAEPSYLQLARTYDTKYETEKAKYKSHDRRDQGTARRFRSENSTSRTYQW